MCPGSCFGSEAGGSSDALGHSEGLGRHKRGDNWQSRWGCLYPSLFQSKKLQKQMEAWLDRVRSLKQKLPAHPVTRDAAAVQADAQREALPLLGQAHCPAKQDLSGAWRTLPGWRPRPGSGGTQALVTRQIRDRLGGGQHGVQGTWQGHWEPLIMLLARQPFPVLWGQESGWLQGSPGTLGVCRGGGTAREVWGLASSSGCGLPLCFPEDSKATARFHQTHARLGVRVPGWLCAQPASSRGPASPGGGTGSLAPVPTSEERPQSDTEVARMLGGPGGLTPNPHPPDSTRPGGAAEGLIPYWYTA